MSSVHEPLALIADSDWAMRELMRRTLEQVGYMVFQSASSRELDEALGARSSISMPCLLIVVSGTIGQACGERLADLGDRRAKLGMQPPQVLLTCEFGALPTCPRLDLPHCATVGLLEKPFDFGLLEGIAFRCRTAGAQSRRDDFHRSS